MTIKNSKLNFGQNSNGYMSLKNIAPNKARLDFYGDICGDMWDKWVDDDKCPTDVSAFLAQIDNNEELEIHINSGGGSVFGGIAIYNQLKRHNGETIAYIDGLAASIASIIPLACDRIIINSSAQYMIHKPSMRASGDANELRKNADLLDLAQQSITEIYMTRAKDGVSIEKISDMINRETWLIGSQAAEYFDFEVENVGEMSACTSDLFGRYKHTPENLKKRQEQITDKREKEKLQLQLFICKTKERRTTI